jgi:hypothetical protein
VGILGLLLDKTSLCALSIGARGATNRHHLVLRLDNNVFNKGSRMEDGLLVLWRKDRVHCLIGKLVHMVRSFDRLVKGMLLGFLRLIIAREGTTCCTE